jgi:malonyl-CoA decarboxylase
MRRVARRTTIGLLYSLIGQTDKLHMPEFLNNLLNRLRGARGGDMRVLCHELLSQRGEASQTVLAQRIIERYKHMGVDGHLGFFSMLAGDFVADARAIEQALEEYRQAPEPEKLAQVAAAVESPRQELFRRINTGPGGTEMLVAMRSDLLRLLPRHPELKPVDSDLKHLFRSWFNRGFLRLERIGWHTSALTLEKLIQYESVHEINGWQDLRRRLEADRRCFAFFQPALPGEPVIFVEVALTKGLAKNLEPLLDIHAPVLPGDKADTAIFYSINNCLEGLRGIPFGSFLIKQVVDELSAELPRVDHYSTLSPLPRFAETLSSNEKGDAGFTRDRLSRLLNDFNTELCREASLQDPVDAFFKLLEDPVAHQKVLTPALRRLVLVYLMQLHAGRRPLDPVAAFHFSNGARLESIDPFANVRPYGLRESYGVMVNYRYIPDELADNHERFVSTGELALSPALAHEQKISAALWVGESEKPKLRNSGKASPEAR